MTKTEPLDNVLKQINLIHAITVLILVSPLRTYLSSGAFSSDMFRNPFATKF
jgi:hypothetical protein